MWGWFILELNIFLIFEWDSYLALLFFVIGLSTYAITIQLLNNRPAPTFSFHFNTSIITTNININWLRSPGKHRKTPIFIWFKQLKRDDKMAEPYYLIKYPNHQNNRGWYNGDKRNYCWCTLVYFCIASDGFSIIGTDQGIHSICCGHCAVLSKIMGKPLWVALLTLCFSS